MDNGYFNGSPSNQGNLKPTQEGKHCHAITETHKTSEENNENKRLFGKIRPPSFGYKKFTSNNDSIKPIKLLQSTVATRVSFEQLEDSQAKLRGSIDKLEAMIAVFSL